MNDLVITKLENVCRVINGRAYKQSELLENGKYRVLRVGNFFTNNNWYYSNLDLPEDKYCSEGDLLFAWSASFGPRIWSGEKVIYHYHIWKLEEREDTVDKLFLYYYLLNRTKSMLGSTHGSIMLHLTKSFMESQPISFPRSLQKQRRIANTLQQIDKKIEINNRINAELESMAKAIYDYWFVQFDFPISAAYAASVGRPELEGKPYKRYGGEMVWNEKMKLEVPKGWEVKSLSAVLVCNQHTRKKGDTYDFINYLDTSNLTKNLVASIQRIGLKTEKVPSRAQRVVQKDDILYSTVRPNQLHFGIIKDPVKNMIASTGFAQLSSKLEGVSNDLVYFFLTSEHITSRLHKIAENSVSSYPSISPNDILNLQIALPKDTSILQPLTSFLDSTHNSISKKQIENQELASLRDWLLPMLMNGQVRVSSAKDSETKVRKIKKYEQENEVRMAAEPETTNVSIPENRTSFAKQVLYGKIVSLTKDHASYSRIKLQKLQYLAEHVAEVDLNWNYYRKAAGPYDPRFMNTIAGRFEKSKWYKERNYRFTPLEKVGEIEKYYPRYFGPVEEKLDKLFSKLKTASEEQTEIVATLYAVWNNRIIKKQPINDDILVEDFLKWSSRKRKYDFGRLYSALQWMREEGFVPTGFGKVIKEKKG